MASNFAYLNSREFEFMLQEWLPMDIVFNYPRYAGYYSKEDVRSVLEPFRKMCKDLLEPANEEADAHAVRLENGKTITPPSFGPLFHQFQSEGWGTANLDDSEGSITLPMTLLAMTMEMSAAACPAFQPYMGLTTGAAELIQSFADEDLKEIFLPKMMDGTWSGTMCLTEPTAGSDVGDILSRAYPTDDPRIYKIKGSKIFITGGDNDFTENIIHLFLARIEGARPGTAGISLFILPKYWVNEDGSLSDNDCETTAVEHKLGLKGSATAALGLGDNNNCRAWRLGVDPLQNDGKGDGMAQMFQMMNGARTGTGLIALAALANAGYNAREYCSERIQGRPLTDPRGERVAIISHEDIRRTLTLIKAHVDAARGMLYKSYFMQDRQHNDPDPQVRQDCGDFVDVVTPMCKAYPTDEAWWLIAEAMQAYGGYGYMEEYPIAQAARDVKIYSIWEGTNYIQGLDYVGRKWTMKKGSVHAKFMKLLTDFHEANKNTPGFEREFELFGQGIAAITEIQMMMGKYIGEGKLPMLGMHARRILRAASIVYGSWVLLEQALIADKRAKELGPDHYDYSFYYGKVLSARYYVKNVLFDTFSTVEVIKEGDMSALEIPLAAFDY